ncbi:MAG: gfo/Idh/MocA family oxidoreductase [Planctomycetota bacterium]|nr:MAG: gfo/Idh/MocA family oxidoreductase [Planctomycetota bacterium]
MASPAPGCAFSVPNDTSQTAFPARQPHADDLMTHDSKSDARPISRRGALLGLAAGLAAPMFVPRSVLGGDGHVGANDRIRVGVIGVGFRATLLMDQLPEAGQLVALSDCDLSRAAAYREKKQASWPIYQDYRDLLDRQDIDAVIVATQAFQRVLPCLHACQAGKDIYAEKPLSLDIHEGRVLVRAVRKYERVFQVGTQQRSMEMNRVACEFIRNGGLGEIREVRCVNYPGPAALPREGYSHFGVQPAPDGLNWDVWLNQAAWRPYHEKWRGSWQDTMGGQMTNWGAHGVDQMQWALGMDDTGPVEMWPLEEKSYQNGMFNGQVAMRYANGIELKFMQPDTGPWGGGIIIGEKGKIEINRNKFGSNPAEIATELRKQIDVTEEERKWSDKLALWQARWHLQNWLDCIRSRATPNSDIEAAHRSVSVCHLANITRFLNRRLRWNPEQEKFEDDQEANAWVARPRRERYALPERV